MPTTYKDYNKREFVTNSKGETFDRTRTVLVPGEVERNGITYVITHNQVYSKINGTLKKVPFLPPDLSEMIRLNRK
ncbi:MAG: hypothetical protein IMZ53_06670 [Thermoplasmata archaeon]|nr:hypothetical protein [Thermoplasmata archaeon]